jgi:signal transduction histidine kinase
MAPTGPADIRMKFFAFLEQPETAGRLLNAQTSPNLRLKLTTATAALVLLVGLADFLTGVNVSLQAFYLIPVALAVVVRGWKSGVVISVACALIGVAGDFLGESLPGSVLLPVWNAAIALITYLVLVWLLASLLRLQHDLERRVEQRTAALASEIAERERLEKNVLEISERERRIIGHDLHDGLGQHLTGTAITGQLLADRLQKRAAEETAEARKVVGLVKAAIDQTRRMAKGLLLAEIDAEGLSVALSELCTIISEQHRITCTFVNHEPAVLLSQETGVASHLFRIAQEAVSNAIRHGGAKHIEVRLQLEHQRLTLAVRDDGSGLPPAAQRGGGLGLRIMAHRARLIGATFTVGPAPGGGTLVLCTLPHDN